MALLQNHLEQISLAAQSIGELEFPPSRPFTNALLHNQEITALIRDTEPHERGLFSIDSSLKHGVGHGNNKNDTLSRRKTVYGNSQVQSSAVVRLLGNDMLRKIQSSNRESSRGRGVDIEVLLQSAEKLCAAYEVPRAVDRIAAVRGRHQQIAASIERMQEKITRQQASLSRFNIGGDDVDMDDIASDPATFTADAPQAITEDDLRAEEEAVRELEARRKALEAQVADMERDLGGLLR